MISRNQRKEHWRTGIELFSTRSLSSTLTTKISLTTITALTTSTMTSNSQYQVAMSVLLIIVFQPYRVPSLFPHRETTKHMKVASILHLGKYFWISRLLQYFIWTEKRRVNILSIVQLVWKKVKFIKSLISYRFSKQ